MDDNLKRIRKKFNQGCVDFDLLSDNDRILVGLSGGKDSLMLVRLLAERARIFKPSISVEAAHVVMDNIPYESENAYLDDYCASLGVKLRVLHGRFDESTDGRKTRCFLCSWNRRKLLFSYAFEHGFNKVALGHHQDDILVTWLMNVTFEGNTSTMMPKLKMEHYPVTIIRPMCMVHEAWISEAARELGFQGQKRTCPYEVVTKRKDMTDVFHHLERLNPEARFSLWRCAVHGIDSLGL